MAGLAAGLDADGGEAAARAIMTTDTFAKQAAIEFAPGGRACRIGGMAKGSGMICPGMATMLCFVTTDVAIAPAMLAQALQACVGASLNMVSVDGDTSTNDMCAVMANGLAGNAVIDAPGAGYDAFCEALLRVLTTLAKMLASDGEGATKLLECRVAGACDLDSARKAAKGVIGSSLVKSAMFGADANWGRVLCALGYSGAAFDPARVEVTFRSAAGEVVVCRDGAGVAFCEETAKRVLGEGEIIIEITLGDGAAEATAWGCDLTYEYVRINGDYRT